MTPERERLVRAVEKAQRKRDAAAEKAYEVGAFRAFDREKRKLREAQAALAAYDAAHKGETDETA